MGGGMSLSTKERFVIEFVDRLVSSWFVLTMEE